MSHSISLILSFFYFRYKLYSDSQKIPNTRGLAPMLEQICLTAFTRRRVSMPSRAYTSFLPVGRPDQPAHQSECQCPLGLIPHFYSITFDGRRHTISGCQCPLGLIPHFYISLRPSMAIGLNLCVNALSGLYLISTQKSSPIIMPVR